MHPRRSIIVAVSQNGVIGKDNRIPWHIPEDFAWFKRHTEGHPIIMGRKTYESIGKILPGRRNVILTRRKDYIVPGAIICNSLDDAIDTLEGEGASEIFIIGGDRVFRETMDRADRIYLTLIHRDYEGDTFLPPLPTAHFRKIFEEKHEGDIPFTFFIYDRREEDRNGYR